MSLTFRLKRFVYLIYLINSSTHYPFSKGSFTFVQVLKSLLVW